MIGVTITKRALVARIKRKLDKSDLKMRAHRSGGFSSDRYYLVERTDSRVVKRDVSLEDMASKLGCLASYEVLETANPKRV